jgi:hypothetical protein
MALFNDPYHSPSYMLASRVSSNLTRGIDYPTLDGMLKSAYRMSSMGFGGQPTCERDQERMKESLPAAEYTAVGKPLVFVDITGPIILSPVRNGCFLLPYQSDYQRTPCQLSDRSQPCLHDLEVQRGATLRPSVPVKVFNLNAMQPHFRRYVQGEPSPGGEDCIRLTRHARRCHQLLGKPRMRFDRSHQAHPGREIMARCMNMRISCAILSHPQIKSRPSPSGAG